MLPEHTPDCFRSHVGVWAIVPSYLQESLGAIRSGLWRPRAQGAPALPGDRSNKRKTFVSRKRFLISSLYKSIFYLTYNEKKQEFLISLLSDTVRETRMIENQGV